MKNYYITCLAMDIVNRTNEVNGASVEIRQKNNDQCTDYAVEKISEFIKNKPCDIEFLSEQVHNAWMEEKHNQGFHAPKDCQYHDDLWEGKFDKSCDKCHIDLYPYYELPENIKEYDRVTVRAVLAAIRKMEEA